MKSRKEITAIIKGIKRQLGKTRPVVLFRGPFQTLIATVLSARTKDTTTYPAAKRLFAKFPNPKKLVKAKVKQIEQLIFPVGFYRTKARRIKQISKILIGKFNFKVPRTIYELTSLPGVGRKTANIVLAFSFKIPAIAVDVHVNRISNRIGLVKTKKPEQTENELEKILRKDEWLEINELMVKFGQRVCRPVGPKCENCRISKYCNYFRENN